MQSAPGFPTAGAPGVVKIQFTRRLGCRLDTGSGAPPRCGGWITDLAVADAPVVTHCCANGTLIVIDPAARTVRSELELGLEAFGEIVIGDDGRTLFVLGSDELQARDITAGVRLASFDAELPLRRLALAGPDTVVVGADVGTLVTMRLERA